MIIENIKLEEINQASNLIQQVFDEFIFEDYRKDGIDYFYGMTNALSIRERFINGSLIFVAKKDIRIIGYIEVINLNHIYLLFVEKEFQKKGIARKLSDFALRILKEKNIELKEITVNSTLSAVRFYEKLGFIKIADYQFKNGILSFPMKKVFK